MKERSAVTMRSMPQIKVALNSARHRIGQQHPNAKLTDADVDLIHELRETGLSLDRLAKKFGVQKACIWKIVTGKTRNHLPTEWLVKNVPDVEPGKPRPRVSARRSLNRDPSGPKPSAGVVELERAIFSWR